MREDIRKVIERCESRIEMSLDCNVGDVRRLLEEIRRLMSVGSKAPEGAAGDALSDDRGGLATTGH